MYVWNFFKLINCAVLYNHRLITSIVYNYSKVHVTSITLHILGNLSDLIRLLLLPWDGEQELLCHVIVCVFFDVNTKP